VSQRFGWPLERVDKRVDRFGAVGKRELNSRLNVVMVWIGARGETM
jgi:hypothetical protein